jgi:hypothetical protein
MGGDTLVECDSGFQYFRKLTSAEERYNTYDRELVGMRDSCLHFRYQLLGVPFTVLTDHSSLRWILSQPDLTAILQRWLVILSQFQMTEISHVTGKDNVVADALSRYPELVQQSQQTSKCICGNNYTETRMHTHFECR